MRALKALLVVPLGFALGGCMTYGGGTAYTTTYTYPAYSTYSYPSYSYPRYGYSSPAIVAPSGPTYYYAPSYGYRRY